MRKKIPVFLFISLSCLISRAQQADKVLNNWSDQSPIEKVHLHLDRDIYMAGETVWFKAYLFSEFLPDTISTSLYVELLDQASRIISRKITPVLFYTARGQIELPDSLPAGSYFIRAYSPTMLNQDPSFIYQHGIFIFSKKNSAAKMNHSMEKFIRLEFFPEGGNFINDQHNCIAFKATDQDGLPVNVNANLKNEKNETIISFSSFHDGMGKFDVTPDGNEKYFVTIDNDAGKTKYYLPASTDKGIIFHLNIEADKNSFEIFQKKDDPIFRAAYIIGQMQHKVVFKQQFNAELEKIHGVIKTGNLYSGILQITVFNKDDIPLAERLLFVDNKEYVQNATLNADTLNFSERGRNHFTFSMKDTLTGTFSLSITDPYYDIAAHREQNIVSDFLLSSDLPGYINDPVYYFSSDEDSVKAALDLVMMTNGWRRFSWKELMAGTATKKYQDQQYITVKGNIKINGTRKDFANQSLMVFISPKEGPSNLQLIKTDEKGKFKLDSMVFFDASRLLFFDMKGKKSKWVDVYTEPDSLTRHFPLPVLNTEQMTSLRKYDLLSKANGGKFFDEYEAAMRAKGLTLPGITIKVKKKSPLEELEDRYVNGLFASGQSNRTIDLTGETIYGQNIFQYLQTRVPGLRVDGNGFDYQVFYRGINSIFLAPVPMAIFLDEIPTDANIVASVPINDVALVKVYDNFVGVPGNAPGGALAIYTKKGDDLFKNNVSQENNRILYHGYSVIKEFYAPDYTVDTTTKKGLDRRITLLWDPNIVLRGIGPKLPIAFYNNDRTSKFRIVIEGFTTAGKLVCIEKIFDANGNTYEKLPGK